MITSVELWTRHPRAHLPTSAPRHALHRKDSETQLCPAPTPSTTNLSKLHPPSMPPTICSRSRTSTSKYQRPPSPPSAWTSESPTAAPRVGPSSSIWASRTRPPLARTGRPGGIVRVTMSRWVRSSIALSMWPIAICTRWAWIGCAIIPIARINKGWKWFRYDWCNRESV